MHLWIFGSLQPLRLLTAAVAVAMDYADAVAVAVAVAAAVAVTIACAGAVAVAVCGCVWLWVWLFTRRMFMTNRCAFVFVMLFFEVFDTEQKSSPLRKNGGNCDHHKYFPKQRWHD